MIDSANTPALLLQRRPTVQAHLLGHVEFARALALQQRLVDDAYAGPGGQITLLICEHSPIVTIGRAGRRADVDLRGVQLAGQMVDVVRVNRGGGAMLHAPGQLAVYPIVPLDWLGWSVGEFLHRFQAGLLAALAQLEVAGQERPGRHGIWGNTGQLVSFGVAVKHWTTYYGAQVHVQPPLPLLNFVTTDRWHKTPIGSLHAELGRSVRMSTVRSRVVRSVAESLGADAYHLYTGHPLLAKIGRIPFASALAS